MKYLKSIALKIFTKQNLYIFCLTLILTVFVSNYTNVFFTEFIGGVYSFLRTGEYKRYEILYDEEGIPFVDYGYENDVYIGKQYQPFTVSNTALQYYNDYQTGNEVSLEKFLNCADWLIKNTVYNDGYGILYYNFDWPTYNLKRPWCSSMAQGYALKVLVRAYELTDEQRYINCANKILNSFFIEVDDGGITWKSSQNGWWYEEYAKPNNTEYRVLNGMMFAVDGVYDYLKNTDNSTAKYIFDQGILALQTQLPVYNMDGYSYYDALKNPASIKYHKIHIDFLNDFYNYTGIEIFREYRDKWSGYQEPMFVVTMIQTPSKMSIIVFILNLVLIIIILKILYVFIIEKLLKKYVYRDKE